MVTEVVSPISRKGGKPGSIHRAESPGARSMPGARGDQSEPSEQPEQQSPATHVHVHNTQEAPEQQQEPEQEARGDSFGAMRRLADRLLGRNRRSAPRDSFRNFPRDG
jgi:hypothetical protein